MSNHNTSNDNSSASATENLNPKSLLPEEKDLWAANNTRLYAKVHKDIYTDPHISNSELRVYILILGYCGSIGICWKARSKIQKDFPSMKASTFSENLASLHKKGYMYRKQISLHGGGSNSYLVPKCKQDEYVKYLKKKRYFKTVNDVEAYFSGEIPKPKDIQIKSTSSGNPALDVRVPEIQHSNITSNIKEIKHDGDKTTTPAAASLSSFAFDSSKEPVHGKSVSNMLNTFSAPDLPVSEKDEILQELRCRTSTDELKQIIKLLDRHWESVCKDATKSPRSFVFGALKGQYLLRTLMKYENEKQKAATTAKVESSQLDNKTCAERLKDEITTMMRFRYPVGYKPIEPERPSATVSCDPVGCIFKITIDRGFGEELLTQTVYLKQVFYNDPNFHQHVNAFRSKIDEVL